MTHFGGCEQGWRGENGATAKTTVGVSYNSFSE